MFENQSRKRDLKYHFAGFRGFADMEARRQEFRNCIEVHGTANPPVRGRELDVQFLVSQSEELEFEG